MTARRPSRFNADLLDMVGRRPPTRADRHRQSWVTHPGRRPDGHQSGGTWARRSPRRTSSRRGPQQFGGGALQAKARSCLLSTVRDRAVSSVITAACWQMGKSIIASVQHLPACRRTPVGSGPNTSSLAARDQLSSVCAVCRDTTDRPPIWSGPPAHQRGPRRRPPAVTYSKPRTFLKRTPC